MTALELIDVANQVLFIGLFAAVLWRALKQPSRAAWDTVLLFGSIAGVVFLARAAEVLQLGEQPWLIGVILLLLAIAPYAMLRLVGDFSRTPRWVLLVGGPVLAIIGVLGFVAFGAAPRLYEIVAIAWFLGVGGYAALAFGRAALATRGITQRRMTAVAFGTLAVHRRDRDRLRGCSRRDRRPCRLRRRSSASSRPSRSSSASRRRPGSGGPGASRTCATSSSDRSTCRRSPTSGARSSRSRTPRPAHSAHRVPRSASPSPAARSCAT